MWLMFCHCRSFCNALFAVRVAELRFRCTFSKYSFWLCRFRRSTFCHFTYGRSWSLLFKFSNPRDLAASCMIWHDTFFDNASFVSTFHCQSVVRLLHCYWWYRLDLRGLLVMLSMSGSRIAQCFECHYCQLMATLFGEDSVNINEPL